MMMMIILVSVENQQETTSSVGDLGKEPYCYIHHELLVPTTFCHRPRLQIIYYISIPRELAFTTVTFVFVLLVRIN